MEVPWIPGEAAFSRGSRQRIQRRRAISLNVNAAVRELNRLYDPKGTTEVTRPSALHDQALHSLYRRFARADPPANSPSPQEAVHELLGTGLAYTGEETALHMGKYDRAAVALPRGHGPPRPECSGGVL